MLLFWRLWRHVQRLAFFNGRFAAEVLHPFDADAAPVVAERTVGHDAARIDVPTSLIGVPVRPAVRNPKAMNSAVGLDEFGRVYSGLVHNNTAKMQSSYEGGFRR
jgi:hypothetical protein